MLIVACENMVQCCTILDVLQTAMGKQTSKDSLDFGVQLQTKIPCHWVSTGGEAYSAPLIM